MELAKAAHTSRPWLIHRLAPDFEVEDVWALPVTGGAEDLPRLVTVLLGGDIRDEGPLVVRMLWSARWKLGALMGWDDESRPRARPASLRERLPDGLSTVPPDVTIDTRPFAHVYQTADEYAAELINGTVHAVMHLGWISAGDGTYRGQMAVLVKPIGLTGRVYMAAIAPLRRHVVYPTLLRQIERRWAETARAGTTTGTSGGAR